MKKILICMTILGVLFLAGCGAPAGTHKIEVTDGKEWLDECPKSAKAGDTVTVYTMTRTEGWMLIKVNGETYEEIKPGTFEFVMPDEDVTITIHSINDPNGEA